MLGGLQVDRQGPLPKCLIPGNMVPQMPALWIWSRNTHAPGGRARLGDTRRVIVGGHACQRRADDREDMLAALDRRENPLILQGKGSTLAPFPVLPAPILRSAASVALRLSLAVLSLRSSFTAIR